MDLQEQKRNCDELKLLRNPLSILMSDLYNDEYKV